MPMTERTITKAEHRQRQLAPLRTGAYARDLAMSRPNVLRFFGLSKAAWNRRLQKFVSEMPKLRTGRLVKPQYRDAILRLLVMREVYARIAQDLAERGLTDSAGEPRRLLNMLRYYNVEIVRLEQALGVLPAAADDDGWPFPRRGQGGV